MCTAGKKQARRRKHTDVNIQWSRKVKTTYRSFNRYLPVSLCWSVAKSTIFDKVHRNQLILKKKSYPLNGIGDAALYDLRV